MHFRPKDDPRPGGPVEWADNWLSNTFAWGSHRFTPGWCRSKEHWTSRMAQHLFTDCPCCLLFRGLILGALPPLVLWALTAAWLLS
jgi:hypothetical protein